MKILIVKFRNIGDVLLTTPLLENLKHHFPDARIDMAVNAGTEEMLTLHPALGKLHIYERERLKALSPATRIVEELKFANAIRKERYDIVVNTTKGDRGLLLAIFSGAPTVIGYRSGKHPLFDRFIDHALPAMNYRHMVEVGLDALRALGREPLDKKVRIHWSEETERKIDTLLEEKGLKERPFVHIHPVSRWLFKCIEDRTMARVIDYCQNTLGYPVVLTAAPVEKELEKIAAILSHTDSEPIDLSGKLTLKETAALDKRASFFIGVDTAVMHMAAANDTPVLAFFGPSAAFHWGPWDNDLTESGYTGIRGNQRMGKHRVLQKAWECVPCDRDGCEGSKISDCLMQMDFGEIRRSIDEMAERRR
ncbi:putative lipopolysaccharide heptosyltransferase III [Hydrogenimonas sp.]